MTYKQYIDEAIAISQGTTRYYLEFKTKFKQEMEKIDNDRLLSDEGKRIKRDELHKQGRKDLADIVKSIHTSYKGNLVKAKQEAEKVLVKNPKPSDADREIFAAKVKDLGVQLALSPNGMIAKRRLDDFLAGVTDDISAQLARDSFAELVGPVIAKLGSQAGQASMQYQTLYTALETKYKPQEYIDARKAIESVGNLENGRIFPYMVETDVNGLLGSDAVGILTEPERYIEA
ncbi:hypothetical protein D1872_144470 [compost metagenome]